MKKTETVRKMCDYLLKWVDAKEKSVNPMSLRRDELTESYGFGHDWNAHFSRDLYSEIAKLDVTIIDTLYCAMCILIREDEFYRFNREKEPDSFRIKRLKLFLNSDELGIGELRYSGDTNLRSACFIIYYQLKRLQELTSNQTNK